MPSQKGLITEEELEAVAKWILDNLSMTQEEHSAMRKKNHPQ